MGKWKGRNSDFHNKTPAKLWRTAQRKFYLPCSHLTGQQCISECESAWLWFPSHIPTESCRPGTGSYTARQKPEVAARSASCSWQHLRNGEVEFNILFITSLSLLNTKDNQREKKKRNRESCRSVSNHLQRSSAGHEDQEPMETNLEGSLCKNQFGHRAYFARLALPWSCRAYASGNHGQNLNCFPRSL